MRPSDALRRSVANWSATAGSTVADPSSCCFRFLRIPRAPPPRLRFRSLPPFPGSESMKRQVHGAEISTGVTELIGRLAQDEGFIPSSVRKFGATRPNLEASIARAETRLQQDMSEWMAGIWRGSRLSSLSAPAIHNTTIIHGNNHGAVQQAGPGSNQHSEIDTGAVGRALAEIETALATSDIDASAKAEIQSDVDSMRAQLRKASPSREILVAGARSIASFVAGVGAGIAANLLAPNVQTLLAALHINP